MHLSTALLGLASLVSPSLAVMSDYDGLPWDGRQIQQNGGSNGNLADYVTVQHQGRPEGYNDDGGVLAIGVDDKAIFSTSTNARRSDLFRIIEGDSGSTTFYRASFMKGEAFLNSYDWQLIFVGSGVFEIGVNASKTPAQVYCRNKGTDAAKWSTEFVPGTWYNFGAGVEKAADGTNTAVEFCTSTGQDELKFNMKTQVEGSLLARDEFHIGPATALSSGSSAMNAQQDVVSFNGISAESTPIGAGAPTPAPSQDAEPIPGSTAGEARSFSFNGRK
ncbi:hypothetical protein PHYSODRAFT_257490 [Phytophthora sojae]|uniref:Glycoside hydrolase 131 catalytic N-terminal domain-containing protein n=1 Tax=Phytophthora sojae (strain P6497) TaxID=1094619 RepID=G4YP88_PHYSP|nr:hypothetical protein PHYSODRAFT_257490 [Phytophthora sojae]EGZ27222.1 hypothetical protein PHYSODRAFT_257490 [Phytophthora sojae]|eukprot:XP_009514497.1 hypothetical protein PHYSODRAFT_257490 [Phytophthora sojae]